MANAVVVVVLGDHVLLADLLGPPAQLGHAILDGAHRQALGFPALDQALDVLRLQACGSQMPVPEVLKLIGDQVQHARTVALCGEAAIAIAMAELLQFVVQIPHGCLASSIPLRVRLPRWFRLMLCCWCVKLVR